MKKNLSSALCAGALLLFASACSNDNNGEEGMDQYTPEQSKEYLEEVATEAISLLDPSAQQPLADLCAYFLENYSVDDIDDMPSNYMNVTDFFRGLNSCLTRGDIAGITRVSYDYVYDIDLDLSNYTGVYEYDFAREGWVKTNNSNDVVYKFTDAAGAPCTLTLSPSNSFSTGEFGSDVDYDNFLVKFNIPTEMTLTLIEGSQTLVKLTVKTNINIGGHTVYINVNGNVMNIALNVEANGTDTQVTEKTTITIDGVTYMTVDAVVNGNNLCNADFYANMEEDNLKNKFSSLFKNATATVNLLGRVQIDVNGSYSPALYDALATYYDSYEFNSETAALAELTKSLATLNSQIIAKVRYNNTSTTQASIGWSYERESWGYGSYQYWEYYIVPVLVFPDNTTYTFEDYFEYGFGGVENQWNNLISKYQRIWGKVINYLD